VVLGRQGGRQPIGRAPGGTAASPILSSPRSQHILVTDLSPKVRSGLAGCADDLAADVFATLLADEKIQ